MPHKYSIEKATYTIISGKGKNFVKRCHVKQDQCNKNRRVTKVNSTCTSARKPVLGPSALSPMQTKPVLPNDWLHCLGRHRIFEASQKDTQNVHQTFSNQANTSRVMTLRGNDLILAVGSQIRVLSLNEVKDAWISAAPRFIDAGLSAFSDLNWLLDVPYRVSSCAA